MSSMSREATLTCMACGFDAPAGDDWETIDVTGVGTMSRCPECGSTRVERGR